jgi:transcription antitermination factor NusG
LKYWLAVYTKSRWEKKVYGLLTEQGFEAYCPLNKVTRQWSDRLKIVEEPLFKSYVFVRLTESEYARVRMINGVVNFVYWLGKPAVIADGDIEKIKRFLNEYSEVYAEAMPVQRNSTVQITKGIFIDKEANVLNVRKNHVEVVIESLGYKLVAIFHKSYLKVI